VAAVVEPEAGVVGVGSMPFEATAEPPAARSEPSCLICSTEIWLLPASTASR
jgi:hypothetical protein